VVRPPKMIAATTTARRRSLRRRCDGCGGLDQSMDTGKSRPPLRQSFMITEIVQALGEADCRSHAIHTSILTGSTILNSSKAACRSTSNDGPSERQNGLYSLHSQIYGKFVTSHLRLIPSAVLVAWTGGLFHWHNAEVTMPLPADEFFNSHRPTHSLNCLARSSNETLLGK
jgi:hypothetical protein